MAGDAGEELAMLNAALTAERARADRAEGFLKAAQEERDRWIARYGEVADRLHDVTTRPAEALERARRWLSDVEHEDGARGETYETMRDLVAEIEGAHGVAQGFVNRVQNTANERAVAAEAERDAAREQVRALGALLRRADVWLDIAGELAQEDEEDAASLFELREAVRKALAEGPEGADGA